MMYDYKVYFREGGSQKEVRRFNMGKKVNFDEFLDRVNEVYPIRDKSYKVIWKDEEDDRITISTNQEFKNLPGLCNIKLEIELETPEEQSSKHLTAKHVNIHCDGCGASGFCGFRYKCLECHDYDLCPKCEAAEVHFEHLMLRIPRPLQKRSKYFKHFYKDAKHFARTFYNDDNNEKDDTSLPRESHHAISSRKRDSQRAHRSCSNFDPWNINVLKEHIRDLVTPFGVDFDFRVVRDNERPTPPAESNVNAADPFADVTTCFTTDKADTEKKSNGVNNNDNKTGSAVNTEYVEVQNDSPAKPDNSEDWTIVEKGSSSSRTSTPPPIVTKSNEHNQKNVTASAPPMNPTKENEEPMPKKIYHSNPKIQKALETLVAMGFSNETGTLAYLLESKNGNLEQVLNIIFSEQSN